MLFILPKMPSSAIPISYSLFKDIFQIPINLLITLLLILLIIYCLFFEPHQNRPASGLQLVICVLVYSLLGYKLSERRGCILLSFVLTGFSV